MAIERSAPVAVTQYTAEQQKQIQDHLASLGLSTDLTHLFVLANSVGTYVLSRTPQGPMEFHELFPWHDAFKTSQSDAMDIGTYDW